MRWSDGWREEFVGIARNQGQPLYHTNSIMMYLVVFVHSIVTLNLVMPLSITVFTRLNTELKLDLFMNSTDVKD